MAEPYECWCWVERDATDREGVIAVVMPSALAMGPMPLQSRREDLAEQMRPVAEEHGRLSRHSVRLVHLREVD